MRLGSIAVSAVLMAAPLGAQEAAPAPDANLVIFRDRAQPSVWTVSVRIDGAKVAGLGEDQYTALRVAPGSHEVKLGWPVLSGQKGTTFRFMVTPGRTHYLEIVGQSRFAGYSYAGLSYEIGSGVGEVPAAHATRAIAACCRFRPPARRAK